VQAIKNSGVIVNEPEISGYQIPHHRLAEYEPPGADAGPGIRSRREPAVPSFPLNGAERTLDPGYVDMDMAVLKDALNRNIPTAADLPGLASGCETKACFGIRRTSMKVYFTLMGLSVRRNTHESGKGLPIPGISWGVPRKGIYERPVCIRSDYRAKWQQTGRFFRDTKRDVSADAPDIPDDNGNVV
jgi:hypothetical protein